MKGSDWIAEIKTMSDSDIQEAITNIDSLMMWYAFKKEYITTGITIICNMLKTELANRVREYKAEQEVLART
jgi:hypothetical protein